MYGWRRGESLMNDSSNQEESLFNAARQLTDPRQRLAFLDAACGNDGEMRRRLDELFASQLEADVFFENLAEEVRQPPTEAGRIGSNSPGSHEPPASPSSAVAQESRDAPDEDAGAVVGRYKLLQRIGEGGFGAVYMAEQKEPVKRRVALKIIKLGMDTRQVVARFEAERQALALMDHPNIARVFDAGATDNGRPYFVMELVHGVPITQHCDANNLPPAERLQLFMQVCRAIQHAHQKGIIHRDIKPSNILVTLHDGVPTPKVIDFGIAKATQMELTEKTLFTQFQQFVGTPAYMSPEQAERSGVDIDTRSDIYSLGVLLYELLTGKTPFDGKELLAAGLDEMRRTICEKDPVRPSTRLTQELVADGGRWTSISEIRNPKSEMDGAFSRRLLRVKETIALLRGDLDWIVMKCLEKDRARRYETANGLALDVDRLLNNDPVEARPPSQLYRLQKLAKRNRIAFTAAAAVATALLLAAVVSVWLAVWARRAEQTARRTLYFAEMNLAQQAMTDGNLGLVRQLLANSLPKTGQPDLRGWEWRYLARLSRGDDHRRLIGHTAGIAGIQFLDDDQLLSAGWERRTIWWDLAQDRATHTLTNSVRTGSVAVSAQKEFAVLNGVNSFSPHGLMLLDLKLQLERPAPFQSFPGGEVAMVDFSPSGELVIGGVDKLWLWDIAAGAKRAEFPVGKTIPNVLRFSPEGGRLATADQQGMIGIWDVTSRSNLVFWHAHDREGGKFITINTLAFSPNGRQLVSAGADGKVPLWDSTTGTRIISLEGHRAPVMEAAFSLDGKWLAAASLDHNVYVWETASWTLAKTFRGQSDEVHHVAWSANGRRLASGSIAGELLLWDWPPSTNSMERREFASASDFNLAETADTLLRVNTDTSPVVEVWDARTLRLIGQYPHPDTNIVSSWILPGSRLIATGDRRGRVGIRDLASGREIIGTNAHAAEVYRLVGSLDGRVLVTASLDKEVRVWTLPTLTLRNTFQLDNLFDAGTITADGSLLAVGYTYGQIDLRDLPDGNRRATWRAHPLNLKALAFSPNGKLLASSSWDRTGKLWDWKRAQFLQTVGGNLLSIESLAFSPDGLRLAAGTGEGAVKLYDVRTAQEVATLKGHRHPVYGLAFGSDGMELMTASAEALCVWRAPEFRDLRDLEARLAERPPNLKP
jgi:eukaryotic-like serine/threonine-protein kinase